MQIDEHRVKELAKKWMNGTISEEEKAVFMQWYNSADDGQPMQVPGNFAEDELTHGLRIFHRITENNRLEDQSSESKVRRVHFLRTTWFRYAAAVLLVLGAALYFFSTKQEKKELSVILKPSVEADVKPPASVYATITLGNGRKVILDSLANGKTTVEGNVRLTKVHDGQIVYDGKSTDISFNTLNNPRGSKVIQVTLSDGTKVWLNSESSVRYPTVFSGSDRVVEVTGETYFEVAKNAKMPFIVRKGNMDVRVTGTHFDVNAYDEEAEIKVTLLEGAVQVKHAEMGSLQLKPGEQSKLNNAGVLTKINNVDVDGVMAWKNGKFDFGVKTDIGTIMREIARWYNLELEYKGTISRYYGGSISRDVNLSQVLKVLETAGDIKFDVHGNKVTVMP